MKIKGIALGILSVAGALSCNTADDSALSDPEGEANTEGKANAERNRADDSDAAADVNGSGDDAKGSGTSVDVAGGNSVTGDAEPGAGSPPSAPQDPTDLSISPAPEPDSALAESDMAATSGSPAGEAPGAADGNAVDTGADDAPSANTNVSLGGSQDFGFFRAQLDANIVPSVGSFDAAGFFAEHHTQLPPPDCGNRVCLQAMLGVMGNLLNGANCTMLQLGLNSPIAADPGNRPPLQLAVVVDTSGSMASGNKIDFVIDGLNLLIDGLHDEDSFALISYNTESTTLFPMGVVADNRVQLRELVNELVANGSTNLYDGLQDGYREVFANYDSAKQNRVILLSDGNPTVGDVDPANIIDMSIGFNSEGVGLTTVGLGTDFNIELMRDLALQADGNFYFLEDSGAVSEVFDEELSFFTVPIAFDLHLEVDAGSDYDFGRAVGSPLWEDNKTGGVLDVPSVFVAHRESAADITDEGGRRGGGSALLIELMPRLLESDGSDVNEADVATINVSFREPGSDEVVEDTIFVKYPHPPWEVLETGFFENINSDNDDLSVVQKSFVMLNIFVGMENAVAAYHDAAGDPSSAIAQLEALLAAARDYNEEVEDEDIEYDIALVEQLIDVMVANDVEPPSELEIPEDPWPED